jgi:hypothetical protein
MTPYDYDRAWWGAWCERLGECCTAAELEKITAILGPGIDDVPTCKERVQSPGADEYSQFELLGGVRFNPKRAASCVNKVRTQSCATLIRNPYVSSFRCDAIEPLYEIGKGCAFSAQCKSGYCLSSCLPQASLGESCDDSLQHPSGIGNVGPACKGGAVCRWDRCEMPLELNEPCEYSDTCESTYCGPDGRCAEPTSCNGL